MTKEKRNFYKNEDTYSNHLCEINGIIQPYYRMAGTKTNYKDYPEMVYLGEGTFVSYDLNGVTQKGKSGKKMHFFGKIK